MPSYHFLTADVFTDTPFTGNPLAVFPRGAGLTDAQMQQIAREFNFSETVFAFPPDRPEHTRRLRIFGPKAELQFAGHPTVGAAYVLAAHGEIALTGDRTTIVFEEGVGPISVVISARDGKPVSAQLSVAQLPAVVAEPPALDKIASLLSLDVSDLAGPALPPATMSCGTPFLLVPLKDRATVARAQCNNDAHAKTLTNYPSDKVFFFALDPERPGSHVRARMFAPLSGMPEDPATGSAAVTLGGYLAARDATANGTLRWRIEQGFEMGRPSILDVEVEKKGGVVMSASVAGASVIVTEGELVLP